MPLFIMRPAHLIPSSRRLSRPPRAPGGFTLTELLVVLGIVAVLTGILIPVIGKVRESARNTDCLSNLREIGKISLLYLADNRNMIVPAGDESGPSKVEWFQSYATYLGDTQGKLAYDGRHELFYSCPSYANNVASGDIKTWLPGYAVNRVPGLPDTGWTNWVYPSEAGKNARRFRITEITNPARRIFFGESGTKAHVGALADFDLTRHGDHTNALFFDFHVAALPSTPEAVTAALNGQ